MNMDRSDDRLLAVRRLLAAFEQEDDGLSSR